MNMLTFVIALATLATLSLLLSSVTAMAHNGEVGHRCSAKSMTWRVYSTQPFSRRYRQLHFPIDLDSRASSAPRQTRVPLQV